jgi:hypothetical protein
MVVRLTGNRSRYRMLFFAAVARPFLKADDAAVRET